jgi:hypothetical protein
VLVRAVERVRNAVGVSPTSRVKNTGTILEKLRRYGGSWLKSIQDLAGMRIVADFDRLGQDALVEQLLELFSAEKRAPKIVDRRTDPVQGYRAVHAIVFPEGVPIEIQVRTVWQHEWAELFEKLADRVGRGIRYGERPDTLPIPDEPGEKGGLRRRAVEAQNGLRQAVVHQAIIAADLISAVEEIKSKAPDAPELSEARSGVEEALATLRKSLEDV